MLRKVLLAEVQLKPPKDPLGMTALQGVQNCLKKLLHCLLEGFYMLPSRGWRVKFGPMASRCGIVSKTDGWCELGSFECRLHNLSNREGAPAWISCVCANTYLWTSS